MKDIPILKFKKYAPVSDIIVSPSLFLELIIAEKFINVIYKETLPVVRIEPYLLNPKS